MNNMAYIFAALLLNESGSKPNAESITAVLRAAGVSEEEVNDGFAQAVESSLEEVDIESIKSEALAFKPASSPTVSSEEAKTEKKEEKEEEKEEKEKEQEEGEEGEESVEGLSSLF